MKKFIVTASGLPLAGKLIQQTLLLCLCFLIEIGLNAQGFSGRTNDVYFNFKGESVLSVLPKITWITPSQESSFNQALQLTISAKVQSDIPLKDLKLITKFFITFPEINLFFKYRSIFSFDK